jgi:uncharacterized membrane protein HdeD (DUF308 family)
VIRSCELDLLVFPLAGVITLTILLIWSGLPGTASWVLGVIIGIDLIFWALILLYSALKRVAVA